MENNIKCEEFIGEMCLEMEMDIIYLKGLFVQDERLEEQIEPLESLGEKFFGETTREELVTVLGRMFGKTKKSSSSYNKTPSSTLDTPDVSGVKDKKNI